MTTAKDDSVTKSGDEPETDAEAERIFAEVVSEREGTPVEKPADPDAEPATTKEGDAEAEVTTGEGDGGEPEGQTGGSEGAAAAAAAPGEGDDIWASADPKAKAAFEEAAARAEKAEQQFKSREGREAALQRKVAELQRQGGGEEQQPRKPLKELLATEEIKGLREEYPDFVPLIDALAEAANRVDGVSEEVGQVKTVAASAGSQAEERELNKAVPNWLELAKDERFLGWVEDQPKKSRDAVAANWNAITNAEAAAEVFKAFAGHIAPPTTEETPSGGAPSKRERQAAGARTATVPAPTSAGGESDEAEVQFKQFAAKKDRERGIIK